MYIYIYIYIINNCALVLCTLLHICHSTTYVCLQVTYNLLTVYKAHNTFLLPPSFYWNRIKYHKELNMRKINV